jgi:NADH:ubiquinone oxidoreductase subunit E
MEKIKVEICFGTACFVMGGSHLQELENALENELKDKVEIIPQSCLGLCNSREFNQAPYVKVNGDVVDGATIDKVINKIKSVNNE